MFKKMIAVVLILAIFAPVVLFAEDVYVTKQGARYHSLDCSLIANKDKEKITQEDAKAKGLEPCARCIGKELSSKQTKEDLVYVTENGKKYHQPECNLIKSRKTNGISLEEAKAKGLEPCRRCFPEMAKAEK